MKRINLVKINIYTKGDIPWIGKKGPIMDLEVSPAIFRILSQDNRIELYLSDEDPRRPIQKEEVKEVEVETVPEVVVEEKVEVQEEVIVETTPLEEVTIEVAEQEVQEEVIVEPEVEVVPEEMTEVELDQELQEEPEEVVDLDAAIEAALEELPEDEEPEDIILTEDEQEFDYDFTQYTENELERMTKKEMKQILLDRGHTNDEFTGRYHDTVQMLIEKVLKTQ